jgi:hypothetical protein
MNTKVCTALFVCLAAFIVKSSASNHTSVNNTIQPTLPTPRQVVVSTSQVYTTNKNNGTINATVILPSASVGPTTKANATTTTGAATTFKSSLPWFVACSLFVARFM